LLCRGSPGQLPADKTYRPPVYESDHPNIDALVQSRDQTALLKDQDQGLRNFKECGAPGVGETGTEGFGFKNPETLSSGEIQRNYAQTQILDFY